MHITQIKLANFKFHKNLTIPLDGNMLLYGENGTGKSSIYWALHSLLRKEQTDNLNLLQNRNVEENFNVEIEFSNSVLLQTQKSNTLIEKNTKTIYFANQNLLQSIIDYDNNFYIVLENKLKKYFPILEEFYAKYKKMNQNLLGDPTEQQKLTNERNENSRKLEELLTDVFNKANDILKNHFNEPTTTLSFYFDGGTLTEDASTFTTPDIHFLIDGIENVQFHFNEAKLKLSALAIFLALIKVQSQNSSQNSLKLLVLDDFLTSLDMANRRFIIKYLFNEFEQYQKIILTHNIQFFNLIKQFLKSRVEINNWDIKNIFTRNIDTIRESIVYKIDDDFIQIAEDYMQENKLQECGGYLRKEFERQVEELRIIDELGIKQKLSDTINQIIKSNAQDLEHKRVQKVLNNAKYYQDTILHASNHYDLTTEVYEKDYRGAIKTLIELRKHILNLKQEKMEKKNVHPKKK